VITLCQRSPSAGAADHVQCPGRPDELITSAARVHPDENRIHPEGALSGGGPMLLAEKPSTFSPRITPERPGEETGDVHGLCTVFTAPVNCVTGEVAAESKRGRQSHRSRFQTEYSRSGNSFTHPISVSRGDRVSIVRLPQSVKVSRHKADECRFSRCRSGRYGCKPV